MTDQEVKAIAAIQVAISSRDDQIATLQKTLEQLQGALKAEQQAHVETMKQHQATTAAREHWRQKCETMGNHPEVLAAALARAEANAKQAAANLEAARAKLKA